VSNPNLFSRLNDEDRNKATSNAVAELRMAALEGGIKQNTAKRAREVIGQFLASLGYTSEIKFDGMDI
jgi:hypothetical protein